MKRDYYEISDDEWDNHSFKPSRVLKRTQNTSSSFTPPPIESFAYGSATKSEASDSSSDDCVEITENLGTFRESLEESLDDEDVELEGDKSALVSRGRRFVVDDDESDRENTEVFEIKSTDEEKEEMEEEEDYENDVVGRALQKCAKISVELKRELYGSSGTACDRYSEVESSSVRIVTQVSEVLFASKIVNDLNFYSFGTLVQADIVKAMLTLNFIGIFMSY